MDALSSSATPLRFLTRAQLKEAKGIGWSNPVLLRKERAGEFPQRVYLSQQVPVWLEASVDRWMLEKMQASRATPTSTAKATVQSLLVRAEKRKKRQAETIST
jgi:predicted DNA-binding transcriptional regulator AlpA